MSESELSVRDHMVLGLEQQRWKYAGAKESTALDQLGLTAPRYYQEVNRLLEHPAAAVEYPLLVNRLRRLREARARARGARHIGWQV